MEVFFHFLLQGALKELPASTHPVLEETFEQVIRLVRRAAPCGVIHRAHRRIAEFAAERVMEIVPDVKSKYGVAGLSKCKRDFELLVKEIARVMKAPSEWQMRKQLAGWMVERLMSQVEYSAETWYWSLMCIREGIVDCCGAETAASVSVLLESLAERSDHLKHAVELANLSGPVADTTAKKLVERGEALGCYVSMNSPPPFRWSIDKWLPNSR